MSGRERINATFEIVWFDTKSELVAYLVLEKPKVWMKGQCPETDCFYAVIVK